MERRIPTLRHTFIPLPSSRSRDILISCVPRWLLLPVGTVVVDGVQVLLLLQISAYREGGMEVPGATAEARFARRRTHTAQWYVSPSRVDSSSLVTRSSNEMTRSNA